MIGDRYDVDAAALIDRLLADGPDAEVSDEDQLALFRAERRAWLVAELEELGRIQGVLEDCLRRLDGSVEYLREQGRAAVRRKQERWKKAGTDLGPASCPRVHG